MLKKSNQLRNRFSFFFLSYSTVFGPNPSDKWNFLDEIETAAMEKWQGGSLNLFRPSKTFRTAKKKIIFGRQRVGNIRFCITEIKKKAADPQ